MLKPDVKSQLKTIVGRERFLDAPEDILSYAYDAYVAECVPEAVIFPVNSEEVAHILALASKERIPVTARGAGTSLSGGAVPARQGLALCFTQMNKILQISTRDRYAIVQPGVVNGDLQKALGRERFFYPPDPASFTVSTIGGNVGENAGGPRCLKYGVTADYVMGLEVVLASGKIIRSGSRNVKDVSGYNLTSLFCGSEGTLGLVTEITLKIMPLPEAHRTILAIYDDLEKTANTVADIIGSGILPVALELMDKTVINVVEDATQLGLPREAEGMLLIEVDGITEAVEKEMNRIVAKTRNNGAIEVKQARTQAETDDLWKARRSTYSAFARLAPTCIVEDATVPVSNVPRMVGGIRAIADKHKVRIGILAHAGDGNMHPVISTDIRNKEEWARVQTATREIFELAVSLDGTLSGEHGIGLAKAEFLPLVTNADTREFMAALKKTVDPHGILNPGKFV
ncbi:MAG: FAD-binding protein [Desulfobacterales bacterium]|nr:MAG: FAD-binding protein [Desulfobacterales bacterium]